MLWRGRKSTPVVDNENSRISGLRKAERIFIWLAFGVAMFAFSAWWWNWLWAQELIYAFTFPGFLLPLFVGWIFYRILKRFLAQRPTQNIVYGFAWSRSTLGILVVVGIVAYFICALLALPLRREADARMNEYIARGEVALMREAAGK